MTSITAEQLKTMQDRNPDLLLINTLPAEHFAATKIPGAINIPQDRADFVDRVDRASGGKSRPIALYCANTECQSSVEAAQKLERAGWENVFEFTGGYEAWQQFQENAPGHVAAPAG